MFASHELFQLIAKGPGFDSPILQFLFPKPKSPFVCKTSVSKRQLKDGK